jgi:hypothetical protein
MNLSGNDFSKHKLLYFKATGDGVELKFIFYLKSYEDFELPARFRVIANQSSIKWLYEFDNFEKLSVREVLEKLSNNRFYLSREESPIPEGINRISKFGDFFNGIFIPIEILNLAQNFENYLLEGADREDTDREDTDPEDTDLEEVLYRMGLLLGDFKEACGKSNYSFFFQYSIDKICHKILCQTFLLINDFYTNSTADLKNKLLYKLIDIDIPSKSIFNSYKSLSSEWNEQRRNLIDISKWERNEVVLDKIFSIYTSKYEDFMRIFEKGPNPENFFFFGQSEVESSNEIYLNIRQIIEFKVDVIDLHKNLISDFYHPHQENYFEDVKRAMHGDFDSTPALYERYDTLILGFQEDFNLDISNFQRSLGEKQDFLSSLNLIYENNEFFQFYDKFQNDRLISKIFRIAFQKIQEENKDLNADNVDQFIEKFIDINCDLSSLYFDIYNCDSDPQKGLDLCSKFENRIALLEDFSDSEKFDIITTITWFDSAYEKDFWDFISRDQVKERKNDFLKTIKYLEDNKLEYTDENIEFAVETLFYPNQ